VIQEEMVDSSILYRWMGGSGDANTVFVDHRLWEWNGNEGSEGSICGLLYENQGHDDEWYWKRI